MTRKKKAVVAIAMVLGCLILFIGVSNYQSAPSHPGRTLLMAHRGVSQTFPGDNVTNETCTAEIIYPPTHDYLENTIRSMRESFRLGADMVEIDIHPTTDGQFAVFHDWTVDCRTNGKGTTRELSMAYLKTLDIGHGYTADGGRTFPFRGKAVGQMPTLDDVFIAFPDKRFLINTKSNSRLEARMLAKRLAKLTPEHRSRIMVYGGGDDLFHELSAAHLSNLVTMSKSAAKGCLIRYIAFGWTGYVPMACRSTIVPVPVDLAWVIWGWPYKLSGRAKAVHSVVFLFGPVASSDRGIDTPELVGKVPAGFDGYVWTNELQIVAPLVRKGQPD